MLLGQMLPGQMLPGQMSPGQMSPGQISGEQLESVLDVLWNLRLKVWSKFGSVTAKILVTLSLCVCMQCHFHVKSNFCHVRLRLR